MRVDLRGLPLAVELGRARIWTEAEIPAGFLGQEEGSFLRGLGPPGWPCGPAVLEVVKRVTGSNALVSAGPPRPP